ncbi:MAG: hypothetical protein LBU67_07675 [Oscillospiraceae bacterium]|jgi:hypothetical protein|nr:hypothetical protein [Oscillospiraceae bacterium]
MRRFGGARLVRWGAAAVLVVALIVAWAPATHWLENRVSPAPTRTPAAPGQAEATQEARQSLAQGGLLVSGAVLDQTLDYLPCGHTVQRRIDAPAIWIGLDRQGLEAQLPDYRLTAFSPESVAMARELPIYCPAHWVLQPDAQGEVSIWQNLYGEAMECLQKLGFGVEDMPEGERQALRDGKPFDAQEELEQWLESMDS